MLTKSQDIALKLLKSGQNIFLTGDGGTGKSYVLRIWIEWLHENGKEVILCAPTGVAAEHIGGQTLHRTFRIPVRLLGPNEAIAKENNYLDFVDIVVIDEISMVRLDIFDYVVRAIQCSEITTQKRKQIVVMGDFFQLPPVIGNKERKTILSSMWNKEIGKGFAFSSPKWNELNFLSFSLVDIVRQSAELEFSKIVSGIRLGKKEYAAWLNLHAAKEEQYTDDGQLAITLCAKREDVRRINARECETLAGEAIEFNAIYTGIARELVNGETDEINDTNLEHCLKLKVGMRVMTCINCPDDGYQNGSMGVIVAIYENCVAIRFDNGVETKVFPYLYRLVDYVVENNQMVEQEVGTILQLPLRPAYAITIHKSQGCTFEKMNLHPQCFEEGQFYVALSRVKSIEGLHLYENVKESDIKVSKEVLEFDKTFD